jgi:hypothetical protein
MKQFMLKTIQYLRSRTQVDTTSGATIPARYEKLLIVKQQILKSDSRSEREKSLRERKACMHTTTSEQTSNGEASKKRLSQTTKNTQLLEPISYVTSIS